MAVLLYQLGIFIAIQLAAYFGKNSRNTAIILISIFTILQVFMSWLLLLQFLTILLSYYISENLFFKKENISNTSQAKQKQRFKEEDTENRNVVYKKRNTYSKLSDKEIEEKIKSLSDSIKAGKYNKGC